MDAAVFEGLDLEVVQRICEILFDHMGLNAEPTGTGGTIGLSDAVILVSKSSQKPFSLFQCAVGPAHLDAQTIARLRGSMASLRLPSAYFISAGDPPVDVRNAAGTSGITLIDGRKFTELANNLPAAVKAHIDETIESAKMLKAASETGRFQRVANQTGSFQRDANQTGSFQRKANHSGGFQRYSGQSADYQLRANQSGRHNRPAELGPPPDCAKCGQRMKLHVAMEGKYNTGRYWQCPNPDCRHIAAIV